MPSDRELQLLSNNSSATTIPTDSVTSDTERSISSKSPYLSMKRKRRIKKRSTHSVACQVGVIGQQSSGLSTEQILETTSFTKPAETKASSPRTALTTPPSRPKVEDVVSTGKIEGSVRRNKTSSFKYDGYTRAYETRKMRLRKS